MFPIQFKRYRQKPRIKLKELIPPVIWHYLYVGLGIFVFLIVLFVVFRGGGTRPEDTAFFKAKELIVGIDVSSGFAVLNEQGEPEGFSCDVARLAIEQVYGEKAITFIAVEEEEASYLLKIGDIDLAIGLFTDSVVRTQGLSLTASYYSDPVYAYIDPNNQYDSLLFLNKRSARVMTSILSKTPVSDYFEEQEIAVELLTCSSYQDGIDGVLSGKIAALIAPQKKMAAHLELIPVGEPICYANYKMMLWKTNRGASSLLSEAIGKLDKAGTIAALMEKWGVS